MKSVLLLCMGLDESNHADPEENSYCKFCQAGNKR